MMKANRYLARCAMAATLSLIFSCGAFADGNDAKKEPAPGTTTWGGLGWGIGVATNFDLGGSRVASAVPVNNIVRITDSSSNVGMGFVLEAHYFLRNFDYSGRGIYVAQCAKGDTFCMEVAHGPFVAIEVGGGSSATPTATSTVTAFVLGWMMGLRHPSLTTSPNSSWNLGVGLRVDPKAQVLGDGFVANQPLPAGETAIRYRTEPRVGFTVLSSFSF
jgi:hypothetical protein